MKKGIYLSVLALSALVYSCKKDDDKSTQELILGKWNQVSYIDNDYYSNKDHRDTTIYQAGQSTVEFLNNGKAIAKGIGYLDTMTYKIEGTKLLTSSNAAGTQFDTVNISHLSETEMKLYSKEVYSNGEYYEGTSSFKK
jgi:hypothetical protein